MAGVKVYGAPWCPDCRRSKQFLGEQRIAYDWIDIDREPDGIGGAELAERLVAHARRYGVEMLSAVGVAEIREGSGHRVVVTDQGNEYCAKAVIIATGSSYRRLGVPGEEDLHGAGIHNCATCDGPFYRGADEVLVIGGGNSGAEEGLSSPSSPRASAWWSSGRSSRLRRSCRRRSVATPAS